MRDCLHVPAKRVRWRRNCCESMRFRGGSADLMCRVVMENFQNIDLPSVLFKRIFDIATENRSNLNGKLPEIFEICHVSEW